MEDSHNLNDKASGVFNTAYGLGSVVAPIIGGVLKKAGDGVYGEHDGGGFRFVCDVLALCAFCFAIIYFFVNILPSMFEKKRYSQMVEGHDNSKGGVLDKTSDNDHRLSINKGAGY